MEATRIRFLRPFTTHLFNPIARRFAGWLPGFGILKYTGRKSGRHYETPINVFRRGDLYLFALTYGRDVQWVKNVLASGGCVIRIRGRDARLVDPEVFHDPERRSMPWPLRLAGGLIGVSDFMRMRRA